MRFIILTILIIVVVSCSNNGEIRFGYINSKDVPTMGYDSDSICCLNLRNSVIHKDIYDNEFDSVCFVKLQLSDDCVLSRIDNIHICDDTIVVIDNKTSTINLFNINGDFVKKYSFVGNGPGEYSRISQSYIRDNDIYITDYVSAKTVHYKSNGEFIKERYNDKCNVSSVYPMSDTVFLETHWYDARLQNSPFELTITDKEQNLIGSARPFLTNLTTYGGNIIFKDSCSVLYYSNFCDTVFRVTPDRIEPYLCLGLLSKEDLDRFYEEAFRTDHSNYLKYINLKCAFPVNYCFWETSSFWIVLYSDGRYTYKSFIDRKTLESHTYIMFDKENGILHDFVNIQDVYRDDWIVGSMTENSINSISTSMFEQAVSELNDKSLQDGMLSIADGENNGCVVLFHIRKR